RPLQPALGVGNYVAEQRRMVIGHPSAAPRRRWNLLAGASGEGEAVFAPEEIFLLRSDRRHVIAIPDATFKPFFIQLQPRFKESFEFVLLIHSVSYGYCQSPRSAKGAQ